MSPTGKKRKKQTEVKCNGRNFQKRNESILYITHCLYFLAVFYIITAFYFVNMNLANGSTDMSYVFAGVFVIMMILLPLLTMRLFADEKKLKTDQGLLTAPVNLLR